ncbi:MAG: hypothetical protein AAGA20_20860 [Planctomycetota bacterium]
MAPDGAVDVVRGGVRRELTGPLERVLEWMVAQRDPATGALICPQHRIEHTGKSAGAVVLAVELARHAAEADRDRLLTIAREQCERIVGRLEREGDSTCFTFRPGRHDPYNCSNSVIDGGACSDALAACVQAFGDRLGADERERFTHASVLHAQTYLRYAIVDKGVPAQCAWAMTGAAQAYRLSGHDVLRYVCEVGAERLAGVQRGDGSFPYHPLEWGAAHPGAGDASAYYQSRVNAFTSFALETAMGADAGTRADATFDAGLDFLHGLIGPDGIKVGAVEAKPWYWGAEYEVVSHPFDIAALATEWRRTRALRAAAALRASFAAWARHLGPDGAPRSHLDAGPDDPARRPSYQCPFFWAAHASWIARSLPELEEVHASDPPAAAPTTGWTHFEDVDLARLDTPEVVAWVRGRRPPGNASHGSPAGGLLRVHSRVNGRDLFVATRFDRRPEAAWSGASGAPSLGRGWRAGRDDLRFSGWLLRSRWRAGAGVRALDEPLRAGRRSFLAFAAPTVSTAFDRDAPIEVGADDSVRIVGPFARRDGSPAGGRVERWYRASPGGALEVEARCHDASGVRGLWYRPALRAVQVEADERRVVVRFGGGGAGETG